jgi:large subunit ribosomal protein L19
MMSNLVAKFEEQQIQKLSEGKTFPSFASGDTVKVSVRIIEGATERVQIFEGLCIAKSNNGQSSTFTLRSIRHGEGVERLFMLYSPLIDKVELVRRGRVRRAKLYYMRELRGKAARIKEKRD